jgi:hypothetical protein
MTNNLNDSEFQLLPREAFIGRSPEEDCSPTIPSRKIDFGAACEQVPVIEIANEPNPEFSQSFVYIPPEAWEGCDPAEYYEYLMNYAYELSLYHSLELNEYSEKE